MRLLVEGELLGSHVTMSEADRKNGSPKAGDMIARDSKNPNDQWLVSQAYFDENYELKD